ncbi:MAG: hypothetical protein LBH92_08680, partial [Bacteroidales bacterium]|nr:hypothetical protein [Bacteroidales bacterium]
KSKSFIKTLTALSVCILSVSCNKDLGERAEGEYTYIVEYYIDEKDAVIDHTGDGWPETPDAKDEGTLTVESVDKGTKLKITLDNGIIFITSKLETTLINPTGSLSFTIPMQTVAGDVVITGINIGKSQDGDLYQGSFGLTSDFYTGESN